MAAVLSNWHNVLRAISMASSTYFLFQRCHNRTDEEVVKIPKPNAAEGDGSSEVNQNDNVSLPQTLVRIPIEQSETDSTQAQSGTAKVMGD